MRKHDWISINRHWPNCNGRSPEMIKIQISKMKLQMVRQAHHNYFNLGILMKMTGLREL